MFATLIRASSLVQDTKLAVIQELSLFGWLHERRDRLARAPYVGAVGEVGEDERRAPPGGVARGGDREGAEHVHRRADVDPPRGVTPSLPGVPESRLPARVQHRGGRSRCRSSPLSEVPRLPDQTG